MNKFVVTGVDGPIGSNLALALAERGRVWGLFERTAVDLDGCETHRLPDDPVELGEMVAALQPDCWVHCGPTARNAWSEFDELDGPCEFEQGRLLAAVIGATRSIGCRLMVLSSDGVFAGPRLFHEETSPTVGATWAGSMAVRLERQLEQAGALLVRTHAYGWSPTASGADFAERLRRELVAGRPVQVDLERHATPLPAADLAPLLEQAYRLNLRGPLHLAGAERTSAFRFAAELAVACGCDGRLVRMDTASPPIDGLLELPLRETSLNTGLARRRLKLPLPMLREGLQRHLDRLAAGFRSRIRLCEPALAAA